MAIKATFKGDGSEFHIGIPARDLTDEDWRSLSEDDKTLVLASRLYNVVGERDTTERERARFIRRVADQSLESVPATSEEGENK